MTDTTTARTLTRQRGTAALRFEDVASPAIPHRTETSAGSVRVVASWPVSDSAAEAGSDRLEAIRLAFELAGGAAGGYAIRFDHYENNTETYPNVWDSESEARIASQALVDPAVVAYIGGAAAGAIESSIADLSQVDPPLLCLAASATWPGLTRPVPGIDVVVPEPARHYPTGTRNLVRMTTTDDAQGRAAAQWAIEADGRRSAVVFHDGGRYGRTTAASFAEAFSAGGGTSSELTYVSPDPVTYEELVGLIAASGADCIYLGAIATPALGRFLGDVRRRYPADSLRIYGPDGLDNLNLIVEVPSGDDGGIIITSPVLPADLEGDAGMAWRAAMQERIGEDRDPDPGAIPAFEGAIALVQAIDAAGSTDRRAILDAIRATRDLPGLTGPISVNADGDRDAMPVRFARLEGQRFITVASARVLA
ncbi:MAG TPA: ABC transporter substrate-binding protein [Thermomicrobiales bacterium]|nr:ABC transporter substrate-binding protein [Thermomicrobiales bacterium]